METVAYVILGGLAIAWLVAMFIGMIAAFPYGLIAMVAFVGFGLLFIKALKDRLASKEDDYYSKNVDK